MKTYRHGDISLIPTKEVKGEEIKHKGSYILAHGEVTGHKHVITVDRPETMKLIRTSDGQVYVKLLDGAIVTHEEHDKIEVMPGTYKVSHEREYDYFSLQTRKVID